MPEYDFSLPDNQSRLDQMQAELQALDGERKKMQSWKERQWYSERFQDIDRKDKFGKPAQAEVLLNPQELSFDNPDLRYAFTNDARKANDFRHEVIGNRFRTRIWLTLTISLALAVLCVLINYQWLILWFILVGGFVGIRGMAWFNKYQQINELLGVLDRLAFEVSTTRIYRKGEASAHIAMPLEQVQYVKEISLGLLVGTYHNAVNVEEDIRRVLDDPQWILIPKSLQGYALLTAWIKEQVPLKALQ